ncbi:MAG: EF-hand domain-containing protein [Verrucomicrobiota bacterium]
MKTIPTSLVSACFWLPSLCLAATLTPTSGGAPEGEGARRRQQHFSDVWKLADTNDDGLLSREEFFAMKRIALLPADKREDLFKRLDKNGDGVLSREELESPVKPQDGKHQRMQHLWDLDTNKDGVISLDEFKAGDFVKKLPPEQQEALFRRLDVNGDGVISPADHPAGERPGPEAPPHDPRHLFRLLDKDGDGALTFEEFRQAPFIRSLDEKLQKERFDKLDRNKDGKIDASEFPHPERKPEGKPEA